MRTVLRGQFFRLWLAQVVSQFGDGMIDLTIMVLVAVGSNNSVLVSLVLLAQLLPTALLGAFTGPLADRVSPKWLMVGSDVYRMLIVLMMMLAAHHPLVLILLIALHGIGSSVFTPARSATIPQVVGDEHIPQAMAISQGTWSAMRIAGPAMGGILLAIHSTNLIFLLDAATFVVSAVFIATLTSVRAMGADKSKEETYFQSLHAGVRQVIGMPALRFLLLLFIPITLAGGMFNTDYNVLLLQTFQVPKLHFGILDSVFAGGSIVGAICAPFFMNRFRPSTMLLTSSGIFGILFILVIGLNDWRFTLGLAPIYVWSLVVGYLEALLNVPISSLFVGITPASFRGRGAALLQAGINIGSIVGIFAGGWIASISSALTATTVAGIILLTMPFIFPWFKGYKALHAVKGKQRGAQHTAPAVPVANGETAIVEAEAAT